MTLKTLSGAAAALSVAIAGSAFAQDAAPAPAAPAAPATAPSNYTEVKPAGTIGQTLRQAGQFTTYLKLMDMAGLGAFLSGAKPITVFVPTDAAFAALPPAELQALTAPGAETQLQQRLVYMLFNGPLDFDATLKGKAGNVPGAAGNIWVDGAATPNTVNNATLLQALKVSNGNIYVIDKVIAAGFTPPAQ